MTESRPILELLQLMVDNKDKFWNSLCAFAFNLRLDGIISEDEEFIILTYIKQNTPDHVKCPNHLYWTIGEIQPRFAWLKQQIELLKQSNQFGEFKGTSGEWSLPHFALNYNAKEEDGFKCDCGYVLADNKYFGAVCEVFYSSDQKLETEIILHWKKLFTMPY